MLINFIFEYLRMTSSVYTRPHIYIAVFDDSMYEDKTSEQFHVCLPYMLRHHIETYTLSNTSRCM